MCSSAVPGGGVTRAAGLSPVVSREGYLLYRVAEMREDPSLVGNPIAVGGSSANKPHNPNGFFSTTHIVQVQPTILVAKDIGVAQLLRGVVQFSTQ
jgi:hypothetical protein